MRTILVLNHKGGVGKTTVALHLASLLLSQRLRVAAADIDPQTSLAQWHSRSRADGKRVPELYCLSSWDLAKRMAALASRHHTLIVDTPPTYSPAVVGLADEADVLVVPVTPGGFELDALQTLLGMPCKDRMHFVLNRADEGRVSREVRRQLEKLGPTSILRNYAIYREVSLVGGNVLDLAPKSNAAHDVRRLGEELFS